MACGILSDDLKEDLHEFRLIDLDFPYINEIEEDLLDEVWKAITYFILIIFIFFIFLKK